MKRLLLRYRRDGDDEDVRVAFVPSGYVFVFPPTSATPTRVSLSELLAVELFDDEADPPGRERHEDSPYRSCVRTDDVLRARRYVLLVIRVGRGKFRLLATLAEIACDLCFLRLARWLTAAAKRELAELRASLRAEEPDAA